MTKQEQEDMNALSLLAFGVKSKWKTLMQKGELVRISVMSNTGNPMLIGKIKYLTVDEIKQRMQNILIEKNKPADQNSQTQTIDTDSNEVLSEEEKSKQS